MSAPRGAAAHTSGTRQGARSCSHMPLLSLPSPPAPSSPRGHHSTSVGALALLPHSGGTARACVRTGAAAALTRPPRRARRPRDRHTSSARPRAAGGAAVARAGRPGPHNTTVNISTCTRAAASDTPGCSLWSVGVAASDRRGCSRAARLLTFFISLRSSAKSIVQLSSLCGHFQSAPICLAERRESARPSRPTGSSGTRPDSAPPCTSPTHSRTRAAVHFCGARRGGVVGGGGLTSSFTSVARACKLTAAKSVTSAGPHGPRRSLPLGP